MPAPRRQRPRRRIQRRGRRASGFLRKTLRVLGALGVSVVPATARRRFAAEKPEAAETDSNARRAEVAELFFSSSKYSPRPRRPRRFHRLRDLSSPLRRRGGRGRRDGFKRRARRGRRALSDVLEKLSACSAISAFGSSPRSLVPPEPLRRQRTPRRIQTPSAPRSQRFLVFVDKTRRVLGVSPRSLVAAAAPRRRRTPRRIQTPSAPRSQSSSDILETILRVLGDLGVSLVSAISRRRCGAERAEHAETAPSAERAAVAELLRLLVHNSPRASRS